MLELGVGAALFRAVGVIYWVVALAGLALALWWPRRKVAKALLAVAVVAAFLFLPAKTVLEGRAERQEFLTRQAPAKAQWEMRCKSAGFKVYRTAADVEGILLLKLRPKLSISDYSKRDLPGAAFAGEIGGDGYIETFLMYEQRDPKRLDQRGFSVGADKSPFPGYRFVDYVDPKDGVRYRYRLKITPNPNVPSAIDYSLTREPARDPSPRYAVTFEDSLDPQDRAMWVAGSTVRVIDIAANNEVMAELTVYAFHRGLGSIAAGEFVWLLADFCPLPGGIGGTRLFVAQVVKPKSEETK